MLDRGWPPWPLGPLAFAVVAAWIVLAWRGRQPRFLAAIAVALLCGTVAAALLADPMAHVEAVSPEGLPLWGGGENTLLWFIDRVEETLPRPWLLWLPSWAWRGLVLLWAVWLVQRLSVWSPWLRRPKSEASHLC